MTTPTTCTATMVQYYDGYQTSTVAQHWRIHTGIEQGDTGRRLK